MIVYTFIVTFRMARSQLWVRLCTDYDFMTDIREHHAGFSVLNQLHSLQSEIPPVTGLAKIFGRSPLNDETLPWYVGLKGELLVGAELDTLKKDGYTVLHSVPIGVKGSDIDHIVITPLGMIYTINTKHHAGKKIWVGGNVLVNGTKTDYVRNSIFEAERVEKLFQKAGQNRVVKPILVFVGAENLDVKDNAKIAAASTYKVVALIKKSEAARAKANFKRDTLLLEEFYSADFWSAGHIDELASQEDKEAWFRSFQKQVSTQRQKRTFIKLVFAAGIFIAALQSVPFFIDFFMNGVLGDLSKPLTP